MTDTTGLPLFDDTKLPAYRKDSPTSLAAAVAIAPRLRGLRLQVMQLLASTGHMLGIDEIAARIGCHILICRPRISELKEAGYVEVVKGAALSALGHRQAVVMITPEGRAALSSTVTTEQANG